MSVLSLRGTWTTELEPAAPPGAIGKPVDVKGVVVGKRYEVRCDFDVVLSGGNGKLSRLTPRVHSTKDGAHPVIIVVEAGLQVAAATTNTTLVSFFPVVG